MKRTVIAAWAVGSGLALAHLLALATYDISPGLLVVLALAMACYGLPFYLLTLLRPPPGHRLKMAAAMSVAACVIVVNLAIPVRRFLPGYRPDPLESSIYLAAPLAECVPIAVMLASL